jgi:hypothetical protein
MTDMELRQAIRTILLDNGESFLNDNGVDTKVCRQVADLIVDRLMKQAITVTLNIAGGVLQGASADLPNITLNLIDFDEFESEEFDRSGRTKEEAKAEWEDARKTLHTITC